MLKRYLLTLLLVLLVVSGGIIAQDEAQPETVTLIGTFQQQIGCEADLQVDCTATQLVYDVDDDLWQASFELEAGTYEYQVVENGDPALTYGTGAALDSEPVELVLEEAATVNFFYSAASHWLVDSTKLVANVPGSYQTQIGCAEDWAPWCLRSLLQDIDGDGTYLFSTTALAAGDYEAKVAVNQSWDVNYGDGGVRGGANIRFSVPSDGSLVEFVFDSATNIMVIIINGEVPPAVGNIEEARAHWVLADTIAWEIERIPGANYTLHYAADGGLELTDDGVIGGETLALTVDRGGLPEAVLAKFPQMKDFTAIKLSADDLEKVPEILKGQLAISVSYRNIQGEDQLQGATSLQIPGVLDDLYAYDGQLGVIYDGAVPTLKVWAPTAKNVTLHLFADSDPATEAVPYPMERDDSGVWSVTGSADWAYQYYLYGVEVYVPSTGKVETNLVTDPYSFSLAMNSTRSQIIDLNDPALMPEGWQTLEKPPLEAPEDIVVYELHMRDFSVFDATVPEEYRGTFMAFTVQDSDGMQHLQALADAGLTHLHLLPMADIATIDENPANRSDPDYAAMAEMDPDGEGQQAAIDALRDADAFNWGYDPYHFTVPEGSYATDPDGTARILEFRQMVQALNQNGLRLVMDVVYNHTNASGQGEKSVFDRIVPGYYHRLNAKGVVETSTCCQNTATEHYMMGKFMIDSVLTWTTEYKVDAYRFDLMGHHMVDNMVDLRQALDALTLEADGVDGGNVYVYGEGWNFGEVEDNQRGINATQFNMAGTGIGTFNDRLRDAVRGGSPFGGRQHQAFISDLYYSPNGITPGDEAEQLEQLLLYADQIRVGLAGNLQNYSFVGREGETVTGSDVLYNDEEATGYTLDPQENIVYVSKHDNETLYDILVYKDLGLSAAELGRMQNMGISIAAFSQGVPFFQAGVDMLRSKSLDRDSYNSGDWFNRLDFTYQTNNFGVGLPMAGSNRDRWPLMAPLLADEALNPTPDDIMASVMHFREVLAMRDSSRLFRLQTAEEIQQRLMFHNTGPDQIPGVIVMSISDKLGEDLDPNLDRVVVVFNASPETLTFTDETLTGVNLQLHPIQVESHDPMVRDAAFDPATGVFTVPARTTAVFVQPTA